MYRSAIFALAMCVCAMTATAADQVALKNGDRLTGTIVKSDDKTLLLKTDFAGDVNLKWEAIAAITSGEALHLGLKDGQTIVGTVTTKDEKFDVITKETGEVVTSKDAVVAVRNDAEQKVYDAQIERLQHPRLTDFWSALVDTGLSVTRGNSESLTYNLAAKAARVTDRDKISVYTTAIYTDSTVSGVDSTTAHAIRGGVRGDLNMTDKVYVFGFTDFEYDAFQHLDLRNVLGGGFGYHFIKTKTTTLDAFGGGDFEQEYFSDIPATATTQEVPALTRKTGEIVVGQEFDKKISDRTTLTERMSFYPNLSDTGDYRLQFDLTAATKLKNWLSWQVTYSDRYLSDPLQGLKKNDLILSTGVRITFGKQVF